MTTTPENIRLHVDAANPGQFFACCGLLEVANRLSPEHGAQGWFAEDARTFHIASPMTLTDLLEALSVVPLTNTMSARDNARLEELSKMKATERAKSPGLEDEKKALEKRRREDPIVLHGELRLTLDWFLDDLSGGSRYKTWAGQQSVLDIATSMKQAHAATDWQTFGVENCLAATASGCGLPFNFDADLGGQGSALDIGFSFDPLAGNAATRITTSARPTLELLAFIGLQRCRPLDMRGNRYQYQAWSRPLSPVLAPAASCGLMPVRHSQQFEFRLLYRTKYLKSFLPAIPLTGVAHV